jgi:hypothetical protein
VWYNAFKVIVGKAADDLGWEPREVQETVWSAVMAIGLLKAGGLKDEEVIDSLTHDLVKQSWNLEAFFDDT